MSFPPGGARPAPDETDLWWVVERRVHPAHHRFILDATPTGGTSGRPAEPFWSLRILLPEPEPAPHLSPHESRFRHRAASRGTEVPRFLWPSRYKAPAPGASASPGASVGSLRSAQLAGHPDRAAVQ